MDRAKTSWTCRDNGQMLKCKEAESLADSSLQPSSLIVRLQQSISLCYAATSNCHAIYALNNFCLVSGERLSISDLTPAYVLKSIGIAIRPSPIVCADTFRFETSLR